MLMRPHRGGDGSDGPARRTCAACGEPIGAYEPGVWIVESIPHETSVAANPELTAAAERAFHASCYDRK
jgi:hypothetical protein